jgi:hypothetical protein
LARICSWTGRGRLSQQNFDAQWISASGKDAFNSIGVGAFFNIMNFGQMLMWHIVLIPIVLAAFIGAHVLLVRVRGVSHPLPATVRLPGRGTYRQRRRALAATDAAPWHGPTAATTSSRKAPSPGESSWSSPWPWPACCPLPTCPR